MRRDDIVLAVINGLKEITTLNGYTSNAGENVFLWLDRPIAEDEYPAIVVRDSGTQINQSNTYQTTLAIEIECYAIGSINNLRAVHNDVIKVMYELENIINTPFFYKSSEYVFEQADRKYYGSSSRFEVFYSVERGKQ